MTQAFLMKTGQGRAKGKESVELDAEFEAELADVLAQVLLLGNHYDLDLQQAIEEKWLAWNPEWPGSRAVVNDQAEPE